MGINFTTPINKLSFGIVGTCLNHFLREEGVKVSLFPLNQSGLDVVEPKYITAIQESLKNAEYYNPDDTSLLWWHPHDLSLRRSKGKHVGMTIFEVDSFTPRELHSLNSIDEIIVNSQWAKQVLEENKVRPHIEVVPLGIDPTIFFPGPLEDKEKIIFLSVGKWEIRKGHDLLIQAFNSAFQPTDNVELWCSHHNVFLTENQTREWENYYLTSKLGNKVKFISPINTHSELANLMRVVDCGVFPNHGEGFGLSILELMACGRPSIVTNCAAQTEYLTQENSLLVDPIGKVQAYDGIWFRGNSNWYDFRLDDFVDRLRDVYHNHSHLKLVKGCKETSGLMTWTTAARSLMKLYG